MNKSTKKKLKKLWRDFIEFRRYHYTSPIYRGFKELLYWLRTHTYNRYHIINIKSPDNGYSWGYLDSDNKMFLAMFKILCDFVEKELSQDIFLITINHVEEAKQKHGPDSWEYIAIRNQFEEQNEFFRLYQWFKYCHPSELLTLSSDEVYEIETKKMRELVDLRSKMWT